ncbi:MAG: DUF2062 domain-containing protein [Phycisphaerales bacterium]|nr:DUF2062 domain-containing protein [Phycisphaerales bacterium]
MAGLWYRARRIIFHRILHADDTPHRIAVGLAAGIFFGLLPTVGLQLALALAATAALRGNKFACLPGVWITNPVTFAPIYYGSYLIGAALLGTGSAGEGRTAIRQLEDLVTQTGIGRHLFEMEFWRALAAGIGRLGAALWVGCLIVATVCGVFTYFAGRLGVTAYRERRRKTLEARHRRRAERRRFARRAPAESAPPA